MLTFIFIRAIIILFLYYLFIFRPKHIVRKVNQWSSTTATLIHIFTGTYEKDKNNGKTYFRGPYYLYAYEVNGKHYESSVFDVTPTIWQPGAEYTDYYMNRINNAKAGLTVGSQFTIYYNPKNPKKSTVLLPGLISTRLKTVFITYTVVILIIGNPIFETRFVKTIFSNLHHNLYDTPPKENKAPSNPMAYPNSA